MKIRMYISAVIALSLAGCSGMKVWEKDRYFQTHVADDFEQREIKTIGVYVFSDGATKDIMDQSDAFDTFGGVFSIISAIWVPSVSPVTNVYGVRQRNFTSAVTPTTTFEPDTTNSGPSLELSQTIKAELEERGYIAKVITDLGHKKEVTAQQCLENAKKQGLDAAFIVQYRGYNKWANLRNIESVGYKTYQINIDYQEGYLYLPNATAFDVKTGGELWQNSYYGLIQHARTFNLAGQPFNIAVNEAVFELGDKSYMDAAPKAAKIIFDPIYWRGSFKEFPARADKKKKL